MKSCILYALSRFPRPAWLIKAYCLHRRDPGDRHSRQQQDEGNKAEGNQIQKKHDVPMPANWYETHIIVARIEFDELEFPLNETQAQTQNISKDQSLEDEIYPIVNKYRPDKPIAGTERFQHSNHLCSFHHKNENN